MVGVCPLHDFARGGLSALGENGVRREGVRSRLEIVEELEAVRPATTDVALWNTGFAIKILAERRSTTDRTVTELPAVVAGEPGVGPYKGPERPRVRAGRVPLACALATLDVLALPGGREKEAARAEESVELREPAVVRLF